MDNSTSKPPPVPRRRTRRMLAVLAVIVFVILFFGLMEWFYRERDTLVSYSSDGAYQIIVREGPRLIDRNFHIVLVDRKTGVGRLIFTSNDQSPTIRRERFAWNEDSSKVALIGDRYYATPESKLDNGEIVFLVYDVSRGKLWCNSDETDQGYERISAKELADTFGKAFWPDAR